MTRDSTGRRRRPPLTPNALEELALRYVGRFATSRAKLRDYLARTIRERGWDGEKEADLEQLAERLSRLGYIDDAAFALSKSRSLSARGYGPARLQQSLRAAGIGDDDAAAARSHGDMEAERAALRFARRRRIGPYARDEAGPREREKAIAAMIRAGHRFDLAKAVIALPPGDDVHPDVLAAMLKSD